MKRKNELRDIYQSDTPDFEKDFTPQVAQELLEERQRDLLRTRIASLAFGGLALVLGVALITLVVREFLSEQKVPEPVQTEETSFIPKYSLPSEAAWVMDYRPELYQIDGEDTPGKKPLSAQWIKKAAYHIIMGQQAMAIGKKKEALEHFSQVVAIYPDIKGVHRALGMLYIENENYEQAVKHLEKALQEEERFDVVNNLGTAYIGTKNYEKALQYLTRALELQPENPACHKNLGVLYRKMNLPDKAIFHIEKYLDLRPEDLDTMQTYALYLTQLGRWQDAADFLKNLTEEVTNVAPIYFLLAQVQIQNGQPEDAVAALQRGIQLIDPTLALAWMNRKEFSDLRGTADFQKLIDQLEIESVSLDNH